MRIHRAKKRVAKRYFDKWALGYDESILQHLVFRSAHNMFFKEIESYGNDELKILDAGCGIKIVDWRPETGRESNR